MAALSTNTRFKKLEPGDILLHSILALSRAVPPEGSTVWTPEEETEALIKAPVVGFIYVYVCIVIINLPIPLSNKTTQRRSR